MATYQGTCHCGLLKFEVDLELVAVSLIDRGPSWSQPRTDASTESQQARR
jgi:hypothetical protein